MKIGDIVHLRTSFKPSRDCSQAYSFGVVAGLIFNDSPNRNYSELSEIVLNLYDPKTATSYVDKAGITPIYSFHPNEISA